MISIVVPRLNIFVYQVDCEEASTAYIEQILAYNRDNRLRIFFDTTWEHKAKSQYRSEYHLQTNINLKDFHAQSKYRDEA
jgi:hypothetical protein